MPLQESSEEESEPAELASEAKGVCKPVIAPVAASIDACKAHAAWLDAQRSGATLPPWSPPGLSPVTLKHTAFFDIEPPVTAQAEVLPDDLNLYQATRVERAGESPVLKMPAGAISEDMLAAAGRLANSNFSAIYIATDSERQLSQLATIQHALGAKPLRLLVLLEPKSYRERHLAMHPRTPKAVADLILHCEDPLASLLATIPAALPCKPALEVFALLKGGGGIDVAGPAASKALLECECRMHNTDAYVSLLSYFLWNQMPQYGWIALPEDVPAGATLGSLVTKH